MMHSFLKKLQRHRGRALALLIGGTLLFTLAAAGMAGGESQPLWWERVVWLAGMMAGLFGQLAGLLALAKKP
ncbi:hypothetical protein [uncultured Aquitalea sp.]|uniref:hypothetical protein n=1 Tax=uncultured Aquitalea sp. TaxID=540272 RepID=UPI0025DDFC81|nr:hypothetical protein [uncultured Aquitalea sp.]